MTQSTQDTFFRADNLNRHSTVECEVYRFLRQIGYQYVQKIPCLSADPPDSEDYAIATDRTTKLDRRTGTYHSLAECLDDWMCELVADVVSYPYLQVWEEDGTLSKELTIGEFKARVGLDLAVLRQQINAKIDRTEETQPK